MKNYQLLVVDDDNRLRELLHKYLKNQGFKVITASDAFSAKEILIKEKPDIIILDVMMPKLSGFKLAEFLRNNDIKIPILFLTAMGDPKDRVKGLEIGASDYMVKPFEPRELLLRIKKILNEVSNDKPTIPLGDYQYDIKRKFLLKDNKHIDLTSGELALLHILSTNIGKQFTREELANHNGINLSHRTIDVQIMRLRKKIEITPKKPRYIKTIRHFGYVLRTD